jgi:hypothetical protein
MSWAQFLNVYRIASNTGDDATLARLLQLEDTMKGKRFAAVDHVLGLLRLRVLPPALAPVPFSSLVGAGESAILCRACHTIKAMTEFRGEDLRGDGGNGRHCRYDKEEGEMVAYVIRCRGCGGGFGWRPV